MQSRGAANPVADALHEAQFDQGKREPCTNAPGPFAVVPRPDGGNSPVNSESAEYAKRSGPFAVEVISSESTSCVHEFVVRSAAPAVSPPRTFAVKPTKFGSCRCAPPLLGSACGETAVHS